MKRLLMSGYKNINLIKNKLTVVFQLFFYNISIKRYVFVEMDYGFRKNVELFLF